MTPSIDNESDVEQKIAYPMLTAELPNGLGYPPECVRTKADVRQLTIGKGSDEKLYYPDYVLVVRQFPVFVVEAKGPGEDLRGALREARLYATELNAKFPSGVNPVAHVAAIHDKELWWARVDSDSVVDKIPTDHLDGSMHSFAAFANICGYRASLDQLEGLRASAQKKHFFRPIQFVGGELREMEELPPNTFGSSLAFDHRHLFNPTSMEERNVIVREAYVPSSRHDRYIDPIDRVIRAAVPPSESQATAIESVENPTEIVKVLRSRQNLQNDLIILVGSVGSGKTTFIDYLREVKLPRDLKRTSEWIHLDMNSAPTARANVYDWLVQEIIASLRDQHTEKDWDSLEILEKVFAPEMRSAERGPLKLLAGSPDAQNLERYRLLTAMQEDRQHLAKAMVRYLFGTSSRRLILVLDNGDKRSRDEQLLFFEVAQWVQRELNCFVILPLRDETYDNHRDQPPLDTVIKDLVFRIEPAMFQEVLRKRINLALRNIEPNKKYEYTLPTGARVLYTGKDQAAYLRSILTSVNDNELFVRRMLTGLAGRNLRKSLELFLEFCRSGHIEEDYFFRVKESEGKESLPFEVVCRVLFRGNRRFYRSDSSHMKNLVALDPADVQPTYYTRIAILRWLKHRIASKGSSGLVGFHQFAELLSDLVLAGYDEVRVQREALYLLEASCIVAEHLREDRLNRRDLVKLTSVGWVHLDLLNSVEYYGTVAEDSFYEREADARHVARSMTGRDHYDTLEEAVRAKVLIENLERWESSYQLPHDEFLLQDSNHAFGTGLSVVDEAKRAIRIFEDKNKFAITTASWRRGQIVDGVVLKYFREGFIVSLQETVTGLAHHSRIPEEIWAQGVGIEGSIVRVRINHIDRERERINLSVNEVVLN